VYKLSEDKEKIQAVWEKGAVIPSYDKAKYRQDVCKAWMIRDRHGDRDSLYGWEIDHIKPKSDDGTDDISNLRPMQWENNSSRSDGKSSFCVVTSDGSKNVKKK